MVDPRLTSAAQVALPHLRDPFAADANRDALADPFGYSDLRGAAAEQQADSTARPMVGVVLKTLADGTTPDWEATVMPSGSRIQRAHRCCRSVAYPLRACELSTRHNTLVTEIGDH